MLVRPSGAENVKACGSCGVSKAGGAREKGVSSSLCGCVEARGNGLTKNEHFLRS